MHGKKNNTYMNANLRLTKILLIIFFSTIVTGCGENSSSTITPPPSENYAEYENLEFWTLSNINSEVTIDDSISFEGSASVKIINDNCADIKLTNVFPVESNQDYEISIAILRHENDIKSKAGVNIIVDDIILETWTGTEDYVQIKEIDSDSFSVIVTQSEEIIMFETATINEEDTWETKTFSFRIESDEPIEIYFVLGCELQLFWIDSFSIHSVLSD